MVRHVLERYVFIKSAMKSFAHFQDVSSGILRNVMVKTSGKVVDPAIFDWPDAQTIQKISRTIDQDVLATEEEGSNLGKSRSNSLDCMSE
jgi:hypothetical protein